MQNNTNKNGIANKNGNSEDISRRSNDHKTQRIKEHLSNIDDKISEEDIQNINTDISSGDKSEKEREADEKISRKQPGRKIESVVDDKNTPMSPWNIVEEST